MIKRLVLAGIGIFFILAVVLMAANLGGHQYQQIDDPVTMQPPASRAACVLNKAPGIISYYWTGY